MPASADGTRERLLDEATRLFAEHGIQGTTTRQITEAAQQRNASAVTYHFGSRDGLLRAVLARQGGPIDDQRGRRRDDLGEHPEVSALVRCLVVPWAASLESPRGRGYVRIVDQLRGRFATWRTESDAATTKHLIRILDELESHGGRPGPHERERIVGMIVLLTGMTADRARRIDDGVTADLSHREFVETLCGMCAAVLTTRA